MGKTTFKIHERGQHMGPLFMTGIVLTGRNSDGCYRVEIYPVAQTNKNKSEGWTADAYAWFLEKYGLGEGDRFWLKMSPLNQEIYLTKRTKWPSLWSRKEVESALKELDDYWKKVLEELLPDDLLPDE